MNIEEAHKMMQDASGIEVGDTVKVLRLPKSHEMGFAFYASTDSSRLAEVGELRIVSKVSSKGIHLNVEHLEKAYSGYWMPFFCLELITKDRDAIVEAIEEWMINWSKYLGARQL